MQKRVLEFRRGTIEDAQVIADLAARTFEQTFRPDNRPEDMEKYLASNFSLDQIKSELASPATIFLLAYEARQLIGYAKLEEADVPPSVSGPDPIELARIYVIKEKIGKGYGSALMGACLEVARNSGRRTLWLGVWQKNIHAISFYQNWGFVIAGTQLFMLGDDVQDDFIMERPVDLPSG